MASSCGLKMHHKKCVQGLVAMEKCWCCLKPHDSEHDREPIAVEHPAAVTADPEPIKV